MQTLSADQFKQKYGDASVAAFKAPTQPAADQSYVQRVSGSIAGDLANRITRFDTIQKRTDTSLPEKSLQMFGQGAGLAAKTAETVVAEVPGIKQAVKGIGEGIKWLSESELSPIKHLGDVIGSSKTLQAATQLYDSDQSFKDTIDAVANIARLGGDVQTAVSGANFSANVTNKVIKGVKDVVPAITEPISAKVSGTVDTAPAAIMNRVARLNPSDAKQFEKLAGQSHGEYLAKTGNFGSPDKIISNEATKFTTSYQSVDDALAKLPGTYRTGIVSDALDSLLEKARNVSTGSVPSPYLSQVRALIAKNEATGLSMEDINAVKRLYERNVKLGYNKLMNADKVEQATNVDSALRDWQVNKAKDLGFTNIQELNKQTQLSKFIVNKLGDSLIGKTGLNSVNLTDWIVLSGGSPTSIAGFLTKKFFSSKAVQAKIAEILNQKEVQGLIKPEVNPTQESAIRSAFPQGTLPALPEGKSIPPQTFTPINLPREGTIESAAQASKSTTVNPKTGDQYVRDLKTGEMKIIPAKPTQPQAPKTTGKATSPNTTIPKELEPLAQEAQKYSSAEEAIQARYVGDTQGAKVSPLDYSALDNDGRWTTQKIATEFNVAPDRVHQLNISLNELPSPKYKGEMNPDEMLNLRGQPAVKIEINKKGELKILDGNHRIDQAMANGDTHIPAWVVDKSQLTDIFNQVHGKIKP